MDHLSKALERADAEKQSVRDWVRPKPGKLQKSTPRTVFEEVGSKVDFDLDCMRRNKILFDANSDSELHIAADRYRVLRTRLMQLMSPNEWKSVGVTGPDVKAGKSLTSINLAIAMARQGDVMVTLIDCDLRLPSVAEYLGFEPGKALPDYLQGHADIEEVTYYCKDIPNFRVIPGTPPTQTQVNTEVIGSTRMREMIEHNSDQDKLVVVDMPPAFVGDDVLSLAAQIDSVLIVVDEGRTKIDELQETTEILSEFNVIGTVLNNSAYSRRNNESYYHYSAAPSE